MKNLIRKTLGVEIKEVNEQEGIIKAILSSGKPDRQGEIIDQSSWMLDEYRKNPVVLWSHNPYEPAIAQMINIGINSDGMLEGEMKFAIKEYDFARTIFNLYDGKFIRAFSVGFVSDNSEEIDGVKILKNNTLYEVSGVNIGADDLALAKSKGIDISLIEKEKKTDPDKKCVENAVEKINDFLIKEGRVLSTKNRSVIEKARDTLNDVLKADEDSRADKSVKPKLIKYKFRKVLNMAVRELLKVRKENEIIS